jgi:tRNA (cmo5U34)-methyltransferase
VNDPSREKSSVDEIRQRFDAEVERFANLETGQAATMDAPLVLDLVTAAAQATNPNATSVLDVGCGAGNYSLQLAQKFGRPLDFTLVDLSQPMLERAQQRLVGVCAKLTAHHSEIRELSLPAGQFDIAMAAAVLHHLRSDDQWLAVFRQLFAALRPGGSLWIADLIQHDHPAVDRLMWNRYGQYLESLGGADYRERVFAYIEREDTPRSLAYQLELLRQVGFQDVEVLHKSGCFAAFGAIKDS